MAAGSARRNLIFGLAVLWVVLLAGLAFVTANPVTLNRDQILLSQATGTILVVDVVDSRTGRVRVRDVLTTAAGLPVDVGIGRELKIAGLVEMKLPAGSHVVLPLILPAGSEELSLAPTRQGPGQAYPADPEVVLDVKQLLAGR